MYGTRLIAEHKEHGFGNNSISVLFSGKMAGKLRRIADLIRPGETVRVTLPELVRL